MPHLELIGQGLPGKEPSLVVVQPTTLLPSTTCTTRCTGGEGAWIGNPDGSRPGKKTTTRRAGQDSYPGRRAQSHIRSVDGEGEQAQNNIDDDLRVSMHNFSLVEQPAGCMNCELEQSPLIRSGLNQT